MIAAQDEAFAAAILELGAQHGINSSSLHYAANLARSGFRSSAWNDALFVGIPSDELLSVRTLIYGQ